MAINTKFKVGDRVLIKPREWFDMVLESFHHPYEYTLYEDIMNFCGQILTVSERTPDGYYVMEEAERSMSNCLFTEDMIEKCVGNSHTEIKYGDCFVLNKKRGVSYMRNVGKFFMKVTIPNDTVNCDGSETEFQHFLINRDEDDVKWLSIKNVHVFNSYEDNALPTVNTLQKRGWVKIDSSEFEKAYERACELFRRELAEKDGYNT